MTQGKLTVTGKPFKVHGPAEGLLRTAVLQYRTYVEGQTSQLLEGTRKFVAAIEQGNLAEAKLLYGPTRIHYEAVEPVAESFVGLDSAIDARIDSPTVDGDYAKWTGFHRIEMLMWAKHTLRGADPLRQPAAGQRADAQPEGAHAAARRPRSWSMARWGCSTRSSTPRSPAKRTATRTPTSPTSRAT